jgi:hypothetical protein
MSALEFVPEKWRTGVLGNMAQYPNSDFLGGGGGQLPAISTSLATDHGIGLASSCSSPRGKRRGKAYLLQGRRTISERVLLSRPDDESEMDSEDLAAFDFFGGAIAVGFLGFSRVVLFSDP